MQKMQKQPFLMQKHLNTDAKTCRIMQKHLGLMQKHAKPPCLMQKQLSLMQNYAKALVLDAKTCKNTCI